MFERKRERKEERGGGGERKKERRSIIKELHELTEQGLQLKVTKKCLLAQFRVRSVYLDRVKVAQIRDTQLQKILFEVQ